MYLKRLQLQGFKTFAHKTEFLYDTGITAIVGPNGSGKSNIADAIRWVLGEQRYSVMRGRKTEDIIFAGSSHKPGMGLAEASITFDNTDRLLPLDFQEVTITRRAFRSGENEYYINKSRVRLRDIVEATTPLSQTYTVITQGMVDAALSQKPEERRGLFEDAASIGLYNLKKAEAEANLARHEDNYRHLQALAAEIEPRLKGLERHARQADEYYSLREELQELLQAFYGDRWRKGRVALNEARQHEAAAQAALTDGQARLEELQQTITAGRAAAKEQRALVVERRQSGEALVSRQQRLQHNLAVEAERFNSLQREGETYRQELARLETAWDATRQRLENLEKEQARLLADQQAQARLLAAHEQLLQERIARLDQAETQLDRQRQAARQATARQDNLRQRLAQTAERRAELARQLQHYQRHHQAIMERLTEDEAQASAWQTTLGGLETQAAGLVENRREVERRLTEAAQETGRTEQALQEARARLSADQARLELLERLQQNYAGLNSGVKYVLQAAAGAQPRLRGVLGLASNLMQAPAGLELAIEVALGGHLQDVLVERFEDAEDAIQLLKSAGAGRVTFLPLDNLPPAPPTRWPALKLAGVRGVAADLIEFETRYRPVYRQLLGRVLVVEDLQTGRAALRELAGGWTVVTPGGEILRSSGAITGGATGKEGGRAEGGLLLRGRELRELPRQVKRLQQEIAGLAGSLAGQQSRRAGLLREKTDLESQERELENRRQAARESLARLQAGLDRTAHELKLREETRQNLERELALLADREQTLTREQAGTLEATRQTEDHLAELELEARHLAADTAGERERLAELRTAVALAGQRRQTGQTDLTHARAEVERLAGDIEQRRQRIADLERRQVQLQRSLERQQAEMKQVNAGLATLRAELEPREAELAALENGLRRQEQDWTASSSELLRLETAHSRAALAAQRLVAELEALNERARTDLAPALRLDGGLEAENLSPAEDDPDLDELAATPELEPAQAAALSERIEVLRARLRRAGAVNPLARQEYRETLARYEFLSRQLTDLSETAATLRSLIKELDDVTQRRFAATFERVAIEFNRFFALLFNGGAARLGLTRPDNLADTGIEILAQPPGKRQQSLALLSGGERALTAVALLFALLEVNPTPFCVLDEVDAALDESNVGRFCETLRTLAHRTQFIVITHNRGTIEAARTIYGVSMGQDSVSKIISLRVDEVTDFKVHGSKLNRSYSNYDQAQVEPVLG